MPSGVGYNMASLMFLSISSCQMLVVAGNQVLERRVDSIKVQIRILLILCQPLMRIRIKKEVL